MFPLASPAPTVHTWSRASTGNGCMRTLPGRAALLPRIALICAGVPASGQAADTGALDATFGISPFGGYRVGGNFTDVNTNQTVDVGSHGSFALALDARADPGREYELFYSRQSTELRGAGVAPA